MTKVEGVGSEPVKPSGFDAFDTLAPPLDTSENDNLQELQFFTKTPETVSLPILPEGLMWKCIKNATSRSRNSRWKSVPVDSVE